MPKGLLDSKMKDCSRYISQAPQPIIRIVTFNPKTNQEDSKNAIVLSPTNPETNVLQGYTFKYSTNDTDGQFSLTLYPGNMGIIKDGETKQIPIFDKIKPLQIVEIWERTGGATPDFVGVINRKKFIAQSGSGLRISITGKSVASFISRFKISLDLNAMSITNELESQDALSRALTASLANGGIMKVSEVLEKIWEYSKACASKCLEISNPDMGKYVSKYLGNDFFTFDNDIELAYPLANIFNGQDSIMFWDIVSGIIPYPVYEKFAYLDDNGKTKIKIREVPFDCSGDGLGYSTWDKLEGEATEIDPAIVKAFDFELSDDEVYTAFFSYVIGSPIEQDKALRLAAQTGGYGSGALKIFKDKAGVYGYSPLTVSFNGYGIPETDTDDEKEKRSRSYKDLNTRVMNWYGHLDEMFKGTLTLATVLKEPMPMCGEVVRLLGGEFYVNEVEHSWNYGGNPETKLTLSRGGDYSQKKFAPLENITKRYSIFRKSLENATKANVNIL